jgi:hypothetical protein
MDGSFTRAEAGLRCDLAAALHVRGDRDEAKLHLKRYPVSSSSSPPRRLGRVLTLIDQPARKLPPPPILHEPVPPQQQHPALR